MKGIGSLKLPPLLPVFRTFSPLALFRISSDWKALLPRSTYDGFLAS